MSEVPGPGGPPRCRLQDAPPPLLSPCLFCGVLFTEWSRVWPSQMLSISLGGGEALRSFPSAAVNSEGCLPSRAGKPTDLTSCVMPALQTLGHILRWSPKYMHISIRLRTSLKCCGQETAPNPAVAPFFSENLPDPCKDPPGPTPLCAHIPPVGPPPRCSFSTPCTHHLTSSPRPLPGLCLSAPSALLVWVQGLPFGVGALIIPSKMTRDPPVLPSPFLPELLPSTSPCLSLHVLPSPPGGLSSRTRWGNE